MSGWIGYTSEFGELMNLRRFPFDRQVRGCEASLAPRVDARSLACPRRSSRSSSRR
jgi:hypothetical protein